MTIISRLVCRRCSVIIRNGPSPTAYGICPACAELHAALPTLAPASTACQVVALFLALFLALFVFMVLFFAL